MPLNSFLIISTVLPPPPIFSFNNSSSINSKTLYTLTLPNHLETPLLVPPNCYKQRTTTTTTATTTLPNQLQIPLAVTSTFHKQRASTTTPHRWQPPPQAVFPPFHKQRTTTTAITTLSNHLQTPLAVLPTSHKQKAAAAAATITLVSKLASIAIFLALNSPSPSLAIPSLNPLLPSTTPFSQSQNLLFGLEDGKIRPCPSTNPGCVSTNPKSSSFAFPWMIPENDRENPLQKLKDAVLKTQRNAEVQSIEDTPDGKYLQVEVDGGFGGRDVLEFLVKTNVVGYRSMAKKVTYVYPFTTALGDSKGQKERMKNILEQVGWYEPSFDYMD